MKPLLGKSIAKLVRSTRGNMNFTESLALKVVSLLLALILWITILGFKREEMKRSLKLEPLYPPGKVLLNRIPSQIQFTFVGPRILLKDLEKRLQPITPDLRSSRENTIPLPIPEYLLFELPAGVKVTMIEPPTVMIRLDDVVERKKPIKANFIGELPPGYELGPVRLTPAEASVSGPRTVVEAMDFINTEPIALDELRGTEERDVTVEVDQGQGLQLSRSQLTHVRISVRPLKRK